jgi:hypothetical protein
MSWKKDKIKIKAVNLQSPGDDIHLNVNHVGYILQCSQVVEVPRLVAEVLQQTTFIEYEVEGKHGEEIKKKVNQRFYVTIVDDPKEGNDKPKEKKDSKKKSILADLKGNEDID